MSDATGSAQLRWDDTVLAVNLVLANPILGTGIGTNALALHEERGARWTAVHNVYLEYAVELGLLGLMLFVLLLVECVKSAGRIQQRTAGEPSQRQLFALAEATQVSLVAFAVAGLFHPVAYYVLRGRDGRGGEGHRRERAAPEGLGSALPVSSNLPTVRPVNARPGGASREPLAPPALGAFLLYGSRL
jgi:hypothetical protein